MEDSESDRAPSEVEMSLELKESRVVLRLLRLLRLLKLERSLMDE
jgi:hypothetical protein